MPKATKVEHDKVFVSFYCAEDGCNESARVSIDNLINCGCPYCSECDLDMVATHSYAEIES